MKFQTKYSASYFSRIGRDENEGTGICEGEREGMGEGEGEGDDEDYSKGKGKSRGTQFTRLFAREAKSRQTRLSLLLADRGAFLCGPFSRKRHEIA